MSVSRLKTWSAGEVLSAADLNAEFDNMNVTGAAFPLTENVNCAGYTVSNAVLASLKQLNDNVTFIDNYASFAAAISSIGSTVTTLIINKNTNVTANATVPSTLTLWFMGQGKLTVSVACTATINGPIIATHYRQIFAGSGTVTGLGLADGIYPDWWTTNATPGTTDMETALEAALDACEASGNTLKLTAQTYAYATSPNFARSGVNIMAQRSTIFKHTGTGNAFILDGGAAGSGILGNRYDNIVVQGNSNSDNGIYVRSIHHSTFINCRCKGAATTGSGILVEWGVLDTWINPTVSSNTGTLSPIPKYGMKLGRRSGTDHTTTQVVTNGIFEGLTQANGAGIYIDFAAKNEFHGGTSEGNTNGIIITGDSGTGNNTFKSMFLEANTGNAIQLESSAVYHAFYDMTCSDPVDIQANAGYNRFIGGVYDNFTIAATGNYNRLYDVVFALGTTLTDNSSTTIYGGDNVAAGGALITNKFRGNIVATASLPAASAAMNGTILIEDAGAGDRNLIIYAGGQRFRLDGGANV